jgi:hypothetical protein
MFRWLPSLTRPPLLKDYSPTVMANPKDPRLSKAPPQWDFTNPAASLHRQAEYLNETCRITFLIHKYHSEMFFMFKADGQFSMSQTLPDANRDFVIAKLKEAIHAKNVYGVIHVGETWTYFPDQNDRTIKRDTPDASIPEIHTGDKREALLVRLERQDGLSHLWLSPILRTSTGIALANALEVNNLPGGRFDSFFHGK